MKKEGKKRGKKKDIEVVNARHRICAGVALRHQDDGVGRTRSIACG